MCVDDDCVGPYADCDGPYADCVGPYADCVGTYVGDADAYWAPVGWAVDGPLYCGNCVIYGLIGTINGLVGISCKYWMPPDCWCCGRYCIRTGVAPTIWKRNH